MSDHLKKIYGSLPTGVCVVTTQTPDRPVGFTASSLSFVSLEPPIAQVSILKTAGSLEDFRRCSTYGVSLLASNQTDVALTFASRGDRFGRVRWSTDVHGVPQILGAACNLTLRSHHWMEMGDHYILFGEIIDTKHAEDTPFLGYAGGTFFDPSEGALV